VRAPSLGIFVVDTGGPPRAMIGPIAHAYEYASSATPRLDDTRALALPAIEDPWTASYTTPAAPEPSFRAAPVMNWDGDVGYLEIEIEAPQPLGQVTLEQLDHHRVVLGTPVTRAIGKGKALVRLGKLGEDFATKLVHVRIGAFHAWLELRCMDGCGSYGFGSMRAPPSEEE
jgi:hypothetical protein